MGTLLKGKGLFVLSDSDNNVGSLFSIEDLLEILDIEKDKEFEFSLALKNIGILNGKYVDEKDLYKHWKSLKNIFSKYSVCGRSSLDEYILLAILHRAYPDATINQQVRVGSMTTDFKITYLGVTKYIEFDGPMHFISSRGKMTEEPLLRIKMINDETGCELVRWPFWIQRCTQNARTIFDPSQKGYGALWTSTAYFSNFTIPNPSDTIKKLTQRFNAEDEDGIGYFYEEKLGPRFQPPHSILSRIKKDKSKIHLLIPKDAQDNKYWVPKELWNLMS